MRHTRSLNRLAIALSALAVTVVALSGCGSGSSSDTAAEPDTAAPVAIESGDEIMAALESSYADAPWLSRVETVDVRTELLARVAFVQTSIDSSEEGAYDIAGEIANAVLDVAGQSIPNVRVVNTGGVAMAGASNGATAEVLDLPSTPGDPVSLRNWLDSVFADSGEAWHAHIRQITLSGDVPGWTGTTVLLVETDLTGASTPENSEFARLIGSAITMSGQTMADSYVVVDASGTNIVSGDIPMAAYAYPDE